jgi:hypothetical protein
MRHCRLDRCVSLLVFVRILVASGSNPGTAVPHVQAAEQLVLRLQPSSNVCPTQELRLPLTAASVRLRPAMFNNWQEVFQQYPDALDYLLTPGDYTSWGPLKLENRSGIPTRKRTIRYYDPETEHLHLAPGSRAGLLPPSPLRTARESFPSSSSSLTNARLRAQFHHGQSLAMHLGMAVGME